MIVKVTVGANSAVGSGPNKKVAKRAAAEVKNRRRIGNLTLLTLQGRDSWVYNIFGFKETFGRNFKRGKKWYLFVGSATDDRLLRSK